MQQEKHAVRKYLHETGQRVFLFRKLAFSLVNSCVINVLGAILGETDRIFFQKL